MDIGAIGLLGAVTVFMTLIVVLLNKRIDDMKAEFKDDMREVKSDMKAFRESHDRLIASVAWLMAKADATSDEVASLYQDPPSDDD